jgi:hypothetical protein
LYSLVPRRSILLGVTTAQSSFFFLILEEIHHGHRYHRLPQIPVQIPFEIFQTKSKIHLKFTKTLQI